MSTAIEVAGLAVSYGGREVLHDIAFSVERGDYLGLVGPNGSGKSTLIRSLLGLVALDRGNVSILGMPRGSFNEWSRLGYLPQKITHFNPFFPATVREIVGLGLLDRKLAHSAEAAAVDEALRLMDITAISGKLIGELSGGQQQRVLLARAVVSRPDILLLDEPTTALDPETRERFYAMVGALNREMGATVVLVTHDIGTVGKYASRLLYLDRTVVFHGGFNDFCESGDMKKYFGEYSQHVICHRHD